MRSQHLWALSAAAAVVLMGGLVAVVVVVVKKDKDSSSALEYCCSFDMENCSTDLFCNTNETSCQDDCNGVWVSNEFLEGQDFFSLPPSPPDNPDSLRGSNAPTQAWTQPPTGSLPVFTEPGQACLPAAPDQRAVTLDLDMSVDSVFLERSDKLCTLWQVNTDRTRIIPVARSYEGHRWEPYNTDVFTELADFECDFNVCLATLPSLLPGHKYELASFDHALSSRDEVARFLEQASFGPTRQGLNDFVGTTTMAQWIKDQQDVVPMTSHREYFRHRLNNRIPYPSSMGLPTHPCQEGARYRRFAFLGYENGETVDLVTDPNTGRKVLYMHGQARTVLDTQQVFIRSGGQDIEVADGSYDICGISRHFTATGRLIRFRVSGSCTNLRRTDGTTIGNPPVFFDEETQPTNPPVVLNGYGAKIASDDWLATQPIEDPNCNLVPPQRGFDIHTTVGIFQGEYYLFDPREHLERNTLSQPLIDGGGKAVKQTKLEDFEVENAADRRQEVVCSSARMSFLNEDHCQLTTEPDACSPRDPPDVSIELTEDTFEKIFQATSDSGYGAHYVYAVEGLRQEPGSIPYNPPCTPGETSRWVPTTNCVQAFNQIDSSTNATIAALIAARASDTNPFVRDIAFPSTGVTCHPNDVNKYGFAVEVDGQCFRNVHQQHLQVFDFTGFVEQHPGGQDQIVQFADPSRADRFRLSFPDWHPMDRFHGWASEFRVDLGRYGDTIPFSELPGSLQQENVAIALGGVATLQGSGPKVICGSPNEIENFELGAGNLGLGAFQANTYSGGGSRFGSRQRRMVWLAAALSAKDGLRQRMAWALSQILVITPSMTGTDDQTEELLVYYDIFIRHAFGSYRNILKEISYSPLMGIMLTYLENKSTDFTWQRRKRVEFADENFAREIMQLFSIGLWKLNMDGTLLRDADGSPIPTYTNDDITQYARVWTGLTYAPLRGNIESLRTNRIDPMRLNPSWHDSFPKLGLDEHYVGDGLPLCSDLPDKHFLKAGATYVLLGSNPSPHYHYEDDSWANSVDTVRPSLDSSSSALYQMLCDPEEGGQCSYPSKVVLDVDLNCYGIECMIQAPRVIEVGTGIFYEYLRVPCAFQVFYSDARMVQRRSRSRYTCEDPRQQTGAVACCQEGSTDAQPETAGMRFTGERVSFTEAEERCSSAGLSLCGLPKNHLDVLMEYWSTTPCVLQAKLGLDATVAIVHSAAAEAGQALGSVADDTKAFFRVVWANPVTDVLSEYDTTCDLLGCERDPSDNLCLCNASVEEKTGFDSAPSRDQVLNDLHFGAFSPVAVFGQYQTQDFGNGVKMYSREGLFTQDSIFEVVDNNGQTRYRKNLRSDVVLGSPNGGRQLKFRNPPHMISIHDPEKRDIHYEIDAALDHYFYHPNTAPFLAVRLAQRFGISNPSPRYISVAANAFRSGRYVDYAANLSFGTGEYGNLGAVVAALLLDREARSVVLDADPSHGSYLEPFLRFMRVLKSLDFGAKPEIKQVQLEDTLALIGQAPHNLPDVFSFFLPEYRPNGPIGNAGLVSPESEVMTGPHLVHLMNGLLSLVKYGLDNAYGGFSENELGADDDVRTLGQSEFASGSNQYHPLPGSDARSIVDELATLLTSGRLAQEKRDLLVAVFEGYGTTPLEKSINVQQLLVTTPEFNSNGLSRNLDDLRPPSDQPSGSSSNYKALVQLFLPGGIDSFNVLAPHACSGTDAEGTPLHIQYKTMRGELALTPSESNVRITANPADGQPCTTFAIHPDIPILKELYDEGSLLFIANAGQVDSSQITKDNYRDLSVSNLFAHNTMRQEARLNDPFRTDPGTGALGRLSEVLTARGFTANSIAINKPSDALTPDSTTNAPQPFVVSQDGSTLFAERPEAEADFPIEELSEQLNSKTDLYSNVFGETWSEAYTTGVRQSRYLSEILAATSLTQNWSNSGYDRSLQIISRLVQASSSRGVNRDIFFANVGGFDHHGSMKAKLSSELKGLEGGIRKFVAELKAMGLWENTVVVVTSEFGRTLTQNGGIGSDHGWGGHYFILGGGVRGGRILGEYPSDITPNGPLTLGERGRIIPSTSWEAIWHGVHRWMGVRNNQEMREILPNLDNTYGNGFTAPFQEADLFQTAA